MLGIEFCKQVGTRYPRGGVPQEVLETKERMYEAMKSLKQYDFPPRGQEVTIIH
jgi:hypothetical protein